MDMCMTIVFIVNALLFIESSDAVSVVVKEEDFATELQPLERIEKK
jgi:hypothetical protein